MLFILCIVGWLCVGCCGLLIAVGLLMVVWVWVARVTCYLLRLLSVWLSCLFSVGYHCCVLVVLGWVLLVCVVGCFAWRVFALAITLWVLVMVAVLFIY